MALTPAKRVSFTLIAVFAPILALEIVVRLLIGAYIDRRVDYNEWIANSIDDVLVADTRGGRAVWYSPYLPRKYFRHAPEGGNVMDRAKGADTYRIFVFGGSSVAGSPFGHWASFARFLGDGLDSMARDGARVEVMNFGMSSGSSATAASLARGLASYEPDLMIVYAGHNEICETSRRRADDGLGRLAAWVFRYSYIYRAMAVIRDYNAVELGTSRRMVETYPCGGKKREVRDPAERRAMVERLRANLEVVAESARDAGAEVLLLGQVPNMMTAPHVDPAWPAARQDAARALHEASVRGDAAAYAAARAALLAIDGDDAHVRYHDGLEALRDGRPGLARQRLEQAIEHDSLPVRFRPSYRPVLEQLAAAPHVTYLDIGDHLGGIVDDGIADGRLIFDSMHPLLAFNRFIAETIIARHFVAGGVRPDLFDAGRFDRTTLHGPFADEAHYGLICRRYYKTSDWAACAAQGREELETARAAGDYGAFRLALRVWENLHYLGRTEGDAALADEGRALFEAARHDPDALFAGLPGS